MSRRREIACSSAYRVGVLLAAASVPCTFPTGAHATQTRTACGMLLVCAFCHVYVKAPIRHIPEALQKSPAALGSRSGNRWRAKTACPLCLFC